jgi:hypothetical protein
MAVLLTGAAAIMGVIAVIASLSYRGFCFAEKRFLSDQAFYNAAIDAEIHRSRIALTANFYTRLFAVVPYKDREAFLQANANCCSSSRHIVGDGVPYIGFDDRLFGRAAKVISISYVVNYVDENHNARSAPITVRYAVTNCGRLWQATH